VIPKRVLAGMAGLLYIVVAVAGGWSELFVRDGLVVDGDVAATAANAADDASLLRLAFAADVVMMLSFLLVGLALHALLRDVSRGAATAMLTLNAVSVAVMAANLSLHAAAVVASGDRYQDALGADASGAMAALFLDLHGIGYLVAQVFFGLYLVPLGYLVLRSGWIPRLLGWLLVVGGVADMGQIAIEYALPSVDPGIAAAVAAPAGIAEMAFAVWLIVRGTRRARAAAPSAGAPSPVPA
jgi:hypothetical protein